MRRGGLQQRNTGPIQGSAQIAVEIQHKDTFLTDKSAIKHVLAAQGLYRP